MVGNFYILGLPSCTSDRRMFGARKQGKFCIGRVGFAIIFTAISTGYSATPSESYRKAQARLIVAGILVVLVLEFVIIPAPGTEMPSLGSRSM